MTTIQTTMPGVRDVPTPVRSPGAYQIVRRCIDRRIRRGELPPEALAELQQARRRSAETGQPQRVALGADWFDVHIPQP